MNSLSELNENKLLKIKAHLKSIVSQGFELISENNSNFDVYESLFKRFIQCFESVNLLLNGIENNKNYRHYPIAIILRASILDYLTILHLKTFHLEKKAGIKNEKSNYNQEYEKLLSDQIRRIISISETEKNNTSYNHNQFCNHVNGIYSCFEYLFDKSIPLDYSFPEKSLKHKRRDVISIPIIRKRLIMFSENLIGIDYEEILNLYNIYSKYDHFGVVSILLESFNINEICDHIFSSLFHLGDGISFCVDFLKEESKSSSNFESFFNEIDSLRGTIYTEHLYLSESYKNELRQ